MYEGVRVNIDHPDGRPDKARSLRDRFGRLRGVRVENDGFRADLHFNPKHSMAEQVLWLAVNDPQALGLSHNAEGRYRLENGREVIEELLAVRHVDLVADPATTRSLYESVQSRPRRRVITKSKLTEADDLYGQKPPMAAGEDVTEPAPADDDGGGVEAHAAAMIEACLQEFKSKDLDYDGLKAKVLKILGVFEDDQGAEETEGATPTEESLKPSKAHRQDPFVRGLLEQLDQHKAKERIGKKRAAARRLIAEAKLPKEAVSTVFMESLLHARDEAAMQQLVQDRAALVKTTKPKSHGRGSLTEQYEPAKVADGKSFAAALGRR